MRRLVQRREGERETRRMLRWMIFCLVSLASCRLDGLALLRLKLVRSLRSRDGYGEIEVGSSHHVLRLLFVLCWTVVFAWSLACSRSISTAT